MAFPGGARDKEPTCKTGDLRDAGSIPGSRIYPGEGNSNPLQHSCLENPMDRGVWRATAHVVAREGHDSSDLAHYPNHFVHCPRQFYSSFWHSI